MKNSHNSKHWIHDSYVSFLPVVIVHSRHDSTYFCFQHLKSRRIKSSRLSGLPWIQPSLQERDPVSKSEVEEERKEGGGRREREEREYVHVHVRHAWCQSLEEATRSLWGSQKTAHPQSPELWLSDGEMVRTKLSNNINTHPLHPHPFPHTSERPSGANIQLTLDKLFHWIVNPESKRTKELVPQLKPSFCCSLNNKLNKEHFQL